MENHLELIKNTVNKYQDKFTSIQSELSFQKESTFAIQQFQKNDYLQRSIVEAPETVMAAIINVATCGISLNPALAHAFLVPRKNTQKQRVECILDISYRGLIHIMTSTGGVNNIYAQTVYKNDIFDIEYGTSPKILHKPQFKSTDVMGVYAVAIMPNGNNQFDYMSKDEIENIRLRSEMGKKGIGAWKTDYSEMAKKTVIKRLAKYLPKNDTMLKAMEAIQIDNENNAIDFEEERRRQETTNNKSKSDGVTSQVEDQLTLATVKESMESMNSKEELEFYWNQLPSETKSQVGVKALYERFSTKLK